MASAGRYQAVLTFLLVYVMLAWPPFLYLNREVLSEVVETLLTVDSLVAVWIISATAILAGLFRASEGVKRYNRFLAAPKNVVAVLVGLSFLLAATSWWLVPEAVFYFEVDVTLNQALVLILLCQAPMLVLLSLLTVLERAISPE